MRSHAHILSRFQAQKHSPNHVLSHTQRRSHTFILTCSNTLTLSHTLALSHSKHKYSDAQSTTCKRIWLPWQPVAGNHITVCSSIHSHSIPSIKHSSAKPWSFRCSKSKFEPTLSLTLSHPHANSHTVTHSQPHVLSSLPSHSHSDTHTPSLSHSHSLKISHTHALSHSKHKDSHAQNTTGKRKWLPWQAVAVNHVTGCSSLCSDSRPSTKHSSAKPWSFLCSNRKFELKHTLLMPTHTITQTHTHKLPLSHSHPLTLSQTHMITCSRTQAKALTCSDTLTHTQHSNFHARKL
jgi:hypothetical protein